MTDSRFVSVNFILPLLCFAYCIDFERICIFNVFQRSTASTSVLFWYSFATSVIVVFIKLIYSLSDRKDIFNFQKPGPLGLVLFARWSVIKEWSVLYPGKISAFVIAELRLLLVKKKSKRQCISGLLLLQVNLLISGLETRQMSIRSSEFIMF